MNATNIENIEWVLNPDNKTRGITKNIFTGCFGPNGVPCAYCYARRLANGRLKPLYLGNKRLANVIQNPTSEVVKGLANPFYPRYWPEKIEQIKARKKPAGILLNDMSDWMGDWPQEWVEAQLQMMRDCPQHRFYTLTKCPQNLSKFSPFPSNCYVGVTATNSREIIKALEWFNAIQATVKFLSIEPLLGYSEDDYFSLYMESLNVYLRRYGIGWILIGAMTGTKNQLIELNKQYPELTLMEYGKRCTLQPELSWIRRIVDAAYVAKTPIFFKDNLIPLLGDNLRQEMPEG